ncbi:MAG TPA: hypothetical protein VNW29_01560 [Candidatus Sulfotelmatobacter sp.]|jgi:hypothetical protein|nr:hypothetical protein [Candidatus Sulfotelmatobacter sp.]
MTKDELLEIAKKLSRQKMVVESMGMINTWQITIEDRIDLDARFIVENDIFYKYKKEYYVALKDFNLTEERKDVR